jgi:hypothetical protein
MMPMYAQVCVAIFTSVPVEEAGASTGADSRGPYRRARRAAVIVQH